jgi:hypothetical protein
MDCGAMSTTSYHPFIMASLRSHITGSDEKVA